MSQPTSGDQWVNVGTLGTVLVANRNAVLKKIILPGTFVGSVEFYDASAIAGTAGTNNIYNVGLPLLNQYRSIDVNANCKNGLVYVATGTPTLTFTWD